MKLTPKQQEAIRLISNPQTHTMLFGGSRSGKTFLLCRALAVRALAAPESRHCALRFRYNHIVQSIALDTFPKMMKLCFPKIQTKWQERPGYFKLPNDSEIWLGGLDDKERTEKILGSEYATIYLNECSQIPWASVGLVTTRLAQVVKTKIEGEDPKQLRRMMLYDCNPPGKGHWTYKVFHDKKDPNTKEWLPNTADYASMQINPGDNSENLDPEYIKTLKGLSPRLQKRFLLGEFADENPNALFSDEIIDKWRHVSGELPDMQRLAIGVDPSGSGDVDNADNDAIGIVVVGLGTDGNGYVLEDCTLKAGPAVWGTVAVTAYDRHQADIIVGEGNFGGAMVGAVIQSARPRTNFKLVNASRGKAQRAEPFSALYEQGKIRHVGYFTELEDELTAFSTMGYMGQGSPNRADALIWALAELFPGIVNPRKVTQYKSIMEPQGWMA